MFHDSIKENDSFHLLRSCFFYLIENDNAKSLLATLDIVLFDSYILHLDSWCFPEIAASEQKIGKLDDHLKIVLVV